MASFASIVLLAAALLMAGRLSHAGPSTAEEVFWRAALPGSAMPDAVLQLLRPAMPERPAVPASGVSGGGDDPFGKYSFSSYDAPSERSGGEAATPTPTPTAEVFWRAVLPGSAVPDAVLRLLRPATASLGVPASGGAGKDPFGYDFKNYKAAPSERSHFRATTRGGGATATATAPTTAVFFHEEAVRVGERLPLHFRAAAPAALGLLPRGVADSIPFTTAALPAVLALLGVPPGSSMAAAMAETLRTCERRPPAGDTEGRFCTTSLEALVERAVAALGTRDVRAVTSALPRAGLPPQVYAVRAVRRLGGGAGASFVACHDEAYPYTVYMCHGTGPARAYLVEMEGARGGGAVTVATVCHTDTSRWNPEHVSFKVLGTKPGGKPVCHLMPYGHIIWAKNGTPSPA